ncbi:MAG: peptide deformylase [Oxalobacter sp.]
MSVRKILKMGRQLLLEESEPITEFDTPELHQLIADLWETMKATDGAGLAAPQIGVLKRVVVFGYDKDYHPENMDVVPATVLINPKLTPLTEEFDERWEGCLSIPGMRGAVPRYTKVRIDAYDVTGKPFSCDAEGFHARVAQHECDHLDGILYPMRMLDLDCFGFNDAFEEDDLAEEQQR